MTVSGNGSYTTPTGATPTQAGTYWWTASYGGDANNNPAATNCGDEQVTIGKASPAIATTAGAGGPPGTTVTDTASLTGGSSPGGSVEFRLYGPSAAADCSGTPVDDETVTVSGNGSYTTPTGAAPTQAGTYWWTASYGGDASNNPAATACGDEQVTITSSAPFGYLSQFGSFGTGNGQFNFPFGVAVDPATGDVYVTDHGNNRVEKFDSNGTYLGQFGSFGDATDPGGAPGQFNEPQGEAIDPATSDLYVADTGNNRVEKFNSNGTYLSQFGSFGTGNGQFNSSFGVAVDPATGDVYVTDYGNNRVQKFDSNGTYLSQFGTSGTGNGQFKNPVGVAVDPATSDVYVTDNGNGRVEKFDSNGNYLSQFGSFGSGNGQFESPQDVAVDPATGDVYVSESDRVQKFDGNGNYLSQFGSSGTGNGQFNLAECVTVDPATSNVYVVDSGHNRVEKFGQ